MDNEKESKSETNSNITPKANYVISDKFPAGLRVLVVDDDTTCLSGLQKMLKILLYEVTTCSSPEDALSMLHECKTGFDIVISDVHLPDMTGFKLLEHIALEMDLPVIMMSVDDKKEVVMKGITHGACDYLIKPVRIEALKTIWQHVVRKRKCEIKELEQTGSVGDNDRLRKPLEYADCSSSVSEGSWKRKKDDEDEGEDKDDTSTLKKPRVVWSVELHQQFVAAVNQLGIDKAVPKKILELMNIPGLTRENVASHLQKYRLYLRRLTGVQQHQNGHSTPFMSSQEANYGLMSTLNGIDFQALAISGQFFSQSAATLQVGGLGRTTMNTGIGMSPVDQRNLLNSDTLKLRFGAGQQLNNSYKHLNVVYGLPTTLEPGDMQVREGAAGFINIPPSSLRTSSTSSHEYSVHGNQSGSLMMQMAESRSRGQFEQASGLPLPTGQQIFPNETVAPVLRRNGTIINGRGAASNPIIQATPVSAYDPVSQSASVADFPMDHITELPGNSFPLENPSGLSSLISTGMFQGGGNFEVKGLRCFPPSYGIFNELHQGKTQDWELQNVDLTFEASQHVTSVQESLDLLRPPLSHQDSACSQNTGQNKNTLASFREGNEHENSESIAQYNNNLLVDNSLQKKARSRRNLGHDMELLGESLDQDELMSTLFKQQQEGVGSEFNFDGYSMDNIPV